MLGLVFGGTVISIVCLLPAVNGQTNPGPSDFKTWLGQAPYSTYNKKVFPRTNQNDNITVELSFFLIAITDFNEVAGEIEMVAYLTAKWENELLRWTITESNMLRMLLPQDQLWKPTIVLSNSVESLKELGDKSYRIRIDNDGNHEWQVGIVSKTACSIDITYYPFDKQSCNITFNPWGYTIDQIDFITPDMSVDLTHYQENVEWTIGSTLVAKEVKDNSVYINFVLNLERKPGYFIVNMIIPILILSLLNGLVFLLPADSGERVGYAITAFLTFAVFLSMVADNLPKASEPMSMLCYFLTLMLCLSAVSTIVTIFVLRVHHQHEESEVPKYLRHIIAFIKCDKCKKLCCPEDTLKEINPDDEEEEDDDDDELKNRDDTLYITWKVAARVLDYFFFLFFLGSTSAITFFFLIPLALAA